MARMKARSAPLGVNAVDALDGVVGGKLLCRRCRRDLPEGMFTPVGRSMISKRGRVLTILHPHCHTCKKQDRGKWCNHPDYTPDLDRFWTKRCSAILANAKSRGILCMIDKDDLLGIYLKQDGYCAVSGLKMNPYRRGASGKTGRHFSMPSVDRINSNGHYEPDNIQIVLDAVNTMKGELPQQVFVELCQQIATKNLM